MPAHISAYREAFSKHLNAHERWQALFDIHDEVHMDDFWQLFRDNIEDTSAQHNHAEIIRRMLTSERVNSPARLSSMNDSDREWFKRIVRRGRKLKIYRGSAAPNRTGFMWTTDIARAAQYAFISGFSKAEVVVGYIKPSKIIIADIADRDIFAFPEDVVIREFRDVEDLPSEQQLMELRMRIMVATHGANHPLQMTPAEYFRAGVNAGTFDATVVVTHMRASKTYLEPLGFKSRIATIDSIIEVLDVRGA